MDHVTPEPEGMRDLDSLRVPPYVKAPSGDEPDPAIRSWGGPTAIVYECSCGRDHAPDKNGDGAFVHEEDRAEDSEKTGGEEAAPARRPGWRQHPGALITAAAVGALLGVIAFAGGMFAGDGGSEDRAAPPTGHHSPTAGVTPSTPAPSASSPSASPSPSRSKGSPSPSHRPTEPPKPSKKPSSSPPATPSASASPKPPAPPAAAGPATLRRGDNGSEVADLQCRLAQAGYYEGEEDGDFDGRVEDAVADFQSEQDIDGDPSGVYGPITRKALEDRTVPRSEFENDDYGGGYDEGYGGGYGY
ncbi:peptidoglycan-binding domain-containing protein [Streptomyces cucumeris]|uniref:peptidoglycan-binding domain-containing protein n=1 Tax=Streptomyces cucumeris TaxID=2962890 RepID=UPI003D74343A